MISDLADPTPRDAAFGRALAARVAPRTARVRRTGARRFVGAVGRASVGFGRAVGRSQEVRPAVTLAGLDSLALRPPVGWWREDGSVADAVVEPAPPTETWTSRLVAATRPAATSRRSARDGRRALPSPPPELVATGDRKLDALRRMLAAGTTPGELASDDGPAAPSPAAPPWSIGSDAPARPVARRADAPVRRAGGTGSDGERLDGDGDGGEIPAGHGTVRGDGSDGRPGAGAAPDRLAPSPADPAAAASPHVAPAERRRGDTVAGPATGPGGFARRLRPENVDGAASPAPRPDPARPLPTGAQRPTPPIAPGPRPAAGRAGHPAGSAGRAVPRSAHRSATDEVDALRRMLERTGRLPGGGSPDPAGAPSGASPLPRSDAPSRPSTSASERGVRPAGPASGGAASPDRSAAPIGSPGPAPTGSSSDGRSIADGSDDASDDASGDAAGDGGPSNATPSGTTNGAVDGAEPGIPRATPRPRRADDLRLRRMITADPAGPDTGRVGVLPTAAPAMIATPADRSIAVPAAPAPGDRTARPPRPSLPASGLRADAILRRVTLPRAMSVVHRPPGDLLTLAAGPVADPYAAAGTITGSATGRVDTRASVVTAAALADVVAGGVPGTPRRGRWSPVAPGAGILQRLARGDAPSPAVIGPATPHPGSATFGSSNPDQIRYAAVGRAVPRPPIDGAPSGPAAEHASGPALRRTVRPVELVVRAEHPPAPPGTRPATGITTPLGHARQSGGVTGPATAVPTLPQGPPTSTAIAPPVPLAERFLTELARSVRRRPAPLPTPFRPMADSIAGPGRVLLSTDTASRRALRSVGKVAATTGDTIHLDPAAAPRSRVEAVLAHELTHVAHPSPHPRFFADEVDSPEERRADAVARVMARSPLAPSSSVLTAPGGPPRPSGSDAIRRAPAGGSGTISAESLAQRLGAGTASPDASDASDESLDVVRRRRRRRATGPVSAGPGPRPNGSAPATQAPDGGSAAQAGVDLDSDEARRWFREQLDRHIDTITERLGDRIVVDLERRGGRMWGGI